MKSVCWSPDGEHLGSCSRDKSVWLWETSDDFDYDCGAVLNGHSQDVKMVKWNS